MDLEAPIEVFPESNKVLIKVVRRINKHEERIAYLEERVRLLEEMNYPDES